jgi:hypothetical protein
MPSIIRRTIAGATVGGAAIWGLAGIDDTTRNEEGEIIESGDLGVFVTQLGDCLNADDPSATEWSTTKGVPCSSPHHWQVIFKGAVASTSYDETTISNEAYLICKYAIDGLAARLSYEKASIYENATSIELFPTQESFEQEDRAVDCLVGSKTEMYTTSLLD